MKRLPLFLAAALAFTALVRADTSAATVSPTYDWTRDEFQFQFHFTNPLSDRGIKSSPESTVYVYVPVAAKKVRALLLLQQNVVEQQISVHPAIRRVCDANAVAIAWCSPGFDLVFKEKPEQVHQLVQEQFRKFGATIGYPELGEVPLIAFGHSNTTAYAQNAAESRPDRVLAVLATHGWNGVNTFNRYRGPALVYVGSFWEQKQQNLGNSRNKGVVSLAAVQQRLERGWIPLSLVEEYGSGHFDYSEPILQLFALYIDKALKLRLAADGSLKNLDPNQGYIAAVPDFPIGPIPLKRYADATEAERKSCPWYFDREMAEATVNLMMRSGPWNRGTQLIGFKNADGSVAPFGKSGPVSPTPYQIVPGTNEIKFWPVLLSEFPAGFKEAGRKIECCSNPVVTIEYVCGPYLYRDAAGKYRVKLNRNGFGGYLAARNAGDDKLRPAVQGSRFVLSGTQSPTLGQRKPDGARQTWPAGAAPIDNPGDQNPGARVSLKAGNAKGEFLGYFVEYGPARVVDNTLEILPLPANTRGPVDVKLTAYRLTQTIEGMSSVTFKVSR